MKKLMVCTMVLVSAAAFAETAAPVAGEAPRKGLTREEYEKLSPAEKQQRHAAALARRYRRTGGELIKPGTLGGEIVYVNCQKRADVALLNASADYFRKESKFAISVRDGEFDLRAPKVQGSVSLFVIDDEGLPPILFAPQNRWAMVNMAPLAKGRGERSAFFEARVRKQLTRGFAILCGATNSQFPMCLLGGVTSADDLDKYTDERLPVDVLARFAPYLKPFGVTPAVTSTYRQGCQEGWAPQPTNDVQKAIWDEVHSLPTNPIEIKYDPKRDK